MKKKGILAALVLFLLALCIPAGVSAASYQWKYMGGGNYKCFLNGKAVKNTWVGLRHTNYLGYMERNTWRSKTANGVTRTYFLRDDGIAVANFKAGWQYIRNRYYYYTSNGVMVKSKWITIPNDGKYYVDQYGVRVTGLVRFTDGYRYFTPDGKNQYGLQKINRNYYYFDPKTRLAYMNGFYQVGHMIYSFSEKGTLQVGWVKGNNGKWYYFNKYMWKNAWLTLNGSRYYLTGDGTRASGLLTISSKLYYFDPSTGALQVNKAITTSDGKKYTSDANGVCTPVTSGFQAPSADMLFFLVFESGSEAYRQAGGDNGAACGAYQFDYRYSLLPFIKWAYEQNPDYCSLFANYVKLSSGESLKSNRTFFNAWKTTYDRHPKAFSALQDEYAKEQYYDPVEKVLANQGIMLAGRSDVVKGSVFSYSIHRGPLEAINAVKACQITSNVSDKLFLYRIYRYRTQQYPAYKYRFDAEYKLALETLEK